MTFIEAIFLGALQGITEFLPISSSGHLQLAEVWLDAVPPSLLFDVTLHLGTLIAVLVMFRRDIVALLSDVMRRGAHPWRRRPGVRQIGLLILASLPTAAIGLAIRPLVEARIGVAWVGLMLVINGLVLLSTRLFRPSVGCRVPDRGSQPGGADRPGNDDGMGLPEGFPGISWRMAILIGTAQGIAVLPGISRSGITIAVALLLGVPWRSSATFSFLLSIPAILGALVLESRQLGELPAEPMAMAFAGMAVAVVLGVLVISWLMAILRRARFHWFGVYCLALGALAISFEFLR